MRLHKIKRTQALCKGGNSATFSNYFFITRIYTLKWELGLFIRQKIKIVFRLIKYYFGLFSIFFLSAIYKTIIVFVDPTLSVKSLLFIGFISATFYAMMILYKHHGVEYIKKHRVILVFFMPIIFHFLMIKQLIPIFACLLASDTTFYLFWVKVYSAFGGWSPGGTPFSGQEPPTSGGGGGSGTPGPSGGGGGNHFNINPSSHSSASSSDNKTSSNNNPPLESVSTSPSNKVVFVQETNVYITPELESIITWKLLGDIYKTNPLFKVNITDMGISYDSPILKDGVVVGANNGPASGVSTENKTSIEILEKIRDHRKEVARLANFAHRAYLGRNREGTSTLGMERIDASIKENYNSSITVMTSIIDLLNEGTKAGLGNDLRRTSIVAPKILERLNEISGTIGER